MSAESSLRLRLLQLTGLSFVGLGAELVLIQHYQGVVQWAPLALCGLGAAVAVLALLHTAPRVVRWAPYVLMAGGGIGVWEHLEHNYAFAAEIQPTAGLTQLLTAAITGASPLLAPGALCLLGALLWLSTRERQGG